MDRVLGEQWEEDLMWDEMPFSNPVSDRVIQYRVSMQRGIALISHLLASPLTSALSTPPSIISAMHRPVPGPKAMPQGP